MICKCLRGVMMLLLLLPLLLLFVWQWLSYFLVRYIQLFFFSTFFIFMLLGSFFLGAFGDFLLHFFERSFLLCYCLALVCVCFFFLTWLIFCLYLIFVAFLWDVLQQWKCRQSKARILDNTSFFNQVLFCVFYVLCCLCVCVNDCVCEHIWMKKKHSLHFLFRSCYTYF